MEYSNTTSTEAPAQDAQAAAIAALAQDMGQAYHKLCDMWQPGQEDRDGVDWTPAVDRLGDAITALTDLSGKLLSAQAFGTGPGPQS